MPYWLQSERIDTTLCVDAVCRYHAGQKASSSVRHYQAIVWRHRMQIPIDLSRLMKLLFRAGSSVMVIHDRGSFALSLRHQSRHILMFLGLL